MSDVTLPTIRETLKTIRADLSGVTYLPSHREYETDEGVLSVGNAPATGGKLLGVFEAKLLGTTGVVVRKYKV